MFEQLITAQIVKAHGLKGEVKIRSFANDPERFLKLRECALENAEGEILAEMKIRRARVAGQDVFLSFQGYPDRSSVECLKGLYLSVNRAKAQTLGPDSWYVCDLIGLEVYDGGVLLGTVKDVQDSGHRDILEVVSDSAEKALYIPLDKQWLQGVDLSTKRIDVNLPEGFLDVFS